MGRLISGVSGAGSAIAAINASRINRAKQQAASLDMMKDGNDVALKSNSQAANFRSEAIRDEAKKLRTAGGFGIGAAVAGGVTIGAGMYKAGQSNAAANAARQNANGQQQANVAGAVQPAAAQNRNVAQAGVDGEVHVQANANGAQAPVAGQAQVQAANNAAPAVRQQAQGDRAAQNRADIEQVEQNNLDRQAQARKDADRFEAEATSTMNTTNSIQQLLRTTIESVGQFVQAEYDMDRAGHEKEATLYSFLPQLFNNINSILQQAMSANDLQAVDAFQKSISDAAAAAYRG